MKPLTVEEALREFEGKTAVLRFLAESAAQNPNEPQSAFFCGLWEICGELETLARATRRTLDLAALDRDIPTRAYI